MKGAQEALANERKYGHSAGPLGKAMVELEAARVKREEEARENSRVMQAFTTSLAPAVEDLQREMGARAAIAEGETLGALRRHTAAVDLVSARWRDVDANTECPACLSRVQRRAKVCAQCRSPLPAPDSTTDERVSFAAACMETICSNLIEQLVFVDGVHSLARARVEDTAPQVSFDARMERFREYQELKFNKFTERSAREMVIIPQELSAKRDTRLAGHNWNTDEKFRHEKRVLEFRKVQLEQWRAHRIACEYALQEFGDLWKHTHYTKAMPDDRLDAVRANLAAGRTPWAATTEEVALRIRTLLAPHAAFIAELTTVAYPEQVGDPVDVLVTAKIVEEARAALEALRHAAWTAAVEGEVARVKKEMLAPVKLPEVGRKVMYAGSSIFASIQYAPEFLTAIGDGAAVGEREKRRPNIRGYVMAAVEPQLELPAQPVRDLSTAMRGLREIIEEEAAALGEARSVALATRTPKRLQLLGVAVGLFVFMASVFTFAPAPPRR